MKEETIIMEKPRQLSNKCNIVLLAIGIVCMIIAGVILVMNHNPSINIQINADVIIKLLRILLLIGFVITVFSIVLIKLTIQANKYLKKLPYSFDYEKELETYVIVGKEKRMTKKGAEYYNNYSEWEEHVRANTIDVNDNFYHFLIRMLRNKKASEKLMISLVIPIEIALLSNGFCDNVENCKIYETLLLTIFLVVFFTINYLKIADEISFLKDYISIMFPEKKDDFN